MRHQKEIRKTIQEHINKEQKLKKERDELYKKLQQKAKNINDSYWCDWESNLEVINKEEAKRIRERKIKLDSKIELLDELGSNLCQAGFWNQ